MTFFAKLMKRLFFHRKIARQRREIMEGDIAIPGAEVLAKLEATKTALIEAQRYERKPDAERLDGEIRVLSWILSYDRTKQKVSE